MTTNLDLIRAYERSLWETKRARVDAETELARLRQREWQLTAKLSRLVSIEHERSDLATARQILGEVEVRV